jgi:hypothetical protein
MTTAVATTAAKPRKPAAKKTRTVDCVDTFPSGATVVRIVERGPRSCHASAYIVAELASEFGGRLFSFAKLGADEPEDVYHVTAGDNENPSSCSCPGHTYHADKGIVCKHRACVAELIAHGKL